MNQNATSIKGEELIQIAFKVMTFFWITSPLTFCLMRKGFGVFNFQADWGIFLGLSLISFITMFFAYKR